MKRKYQCPECSSDEVYETGGYEDGGGDYGDSLTPILQCNECNASFTADEAVIYWDETPDD